MLPGAVNDDVAAICDPAPVVAAGSETLPLIPPTAGMAALLAAAPTAIDEDALLGVGVETGMVGPGDDAPPPPTDRDR